MANDAMGRAAIDTQSQAPAVKRSMVSGQVAGNLSRSSYVRRMFEQGERMRRELGQGKVFDFSLGNPEAEPPRRVAEAMARLAADPGAGAHRYMSNAGYLDVRERVADMLTRRGGAGVKASRVIMTVGAAGGLNALLKAILNPGDEIVAIAPYFMEYGFYAQNHGGSVVVSRSNPDTFLPDPGSLEAAIGPRTRAVILNSPNNPSGALYDDKCLAGVAEVIDACERRFGTSILAISDEPYSSVVYDGRKPSNMLACFRNVAIVNSYSKSHALAGERIGFVAIGDETECADELAEAVVFCNRVLGYVNAPAYFQKVVAECLYDSVGIEHYEERRNAACSVLADAGFDFMKPQGAFYLFPRIMGDDEEAFKDRALAHGILIVPGSGFAWPGHFRMAFCVGLDMIKQSRQAFMDLVAEYR